MREVILGDGEWEKKEQVEFREVEYADKTRAFVGETEFDGHYVLWGFQYFPTTYLKSSGLSGDEWRKGGEIRYFLNRKQVFSEFCRTPEGAALRIGKTLQQLMDFPWDVLRVGNKVWYQRTPAVIKMVLEDQGCVILETEDGSNFPDAVWHRKETGAMGEGEETVKVEILDQNVYWYRIDPLTPLPPINMTRIGTLKCWLWGHVFVGESQWLEDGPRGPKSIRKTQLERSDFCLYCGFTPDKIQENERD